MTSTLSEVVEALLSGEDERAEFAMPTLAQVEGTSLVSALAQRLPGAHVNARWWIARALAAIPVPQSVSLLSKLMDDPISDVRACAAMALGERGAVDGIDVLVSHLADGSVYVARVCAAALSRIGAPAVPALVRTLQEGVPLERIHATRALVPIESHEAIPALIRALDDESAIVAHYAQDALQRMGVGMILVKP